MMIETILTIAFSGAASGAATLLVLKNDVQWIKERLKEHHECLDEHHDRIVYLERRK